MTDTARMMTPDRVGVLVTLAVLVLYRRHPEAKRHPEEHVRRLAAEEVMAELRGKPPAVLAEYERGLRAALGRKEAPE